MTIEHDEFMRVVGMTAAAAQRIAKRDDAPVDLGPADSSRYREGARVWGFRPSQTSKCLCSTCKRVRAN